MVAFAVALAISACLRARAPEADLILVDGVVHTMSATGGTAAAMAVRDGRLLAVGDEESILRHRGETTPVVDLRGATIVPGLIDAHVHLLGVGETLLNEETGGALYVDLSMTQSEEDAVQRVRSRVRSMRPGEWVLGRGWNQERWTERRLPDKRLLSEIVRYNPAFLVRSDGHAVWVNRAALERAGIDARTPDPPGGRILREPRTGEPSGLLLDRAWEPVLREIPALSVEEKVAALSRALREFAARGYTMVHSAGSLNRLGLRDLGASGDEEVEIFRTLALSRRLPIRVVLMVPGPSEAAESLLRRGPEVGLGDDRLDIRTIELFADGTLGSRGAALLEPYADAPDTSGLLRMTRDEIAGWASRGLRSGIQVAVHAVGDAAVREAVNGLARALTGSPGADARFRIEHLSLFDPADLETLARTRAVVSVQPGLLQPYSGVTMEEARVGEERASRVYAFGTLLREGVPLAGSSDAHERLTHPLLGFYSAVTRRTPDGGPAEGWHPGRRLTRAEALRLFTLGAAYAALREGDGGSLEPGKWADFTVLSQDIMAVPADEILETQTLATYVAGHEVYRRHRSAPP